MVSTFIGFSGSLSVNTTGKSSAMMSLRHLIRAELAHAGNVPDIIPRFCRSCQLTRTVWLQSATMRAVLVTECLSLARVSVDSPSTFMESPDALISSASDLFTFNLTCRATRLEIAICVELVSGIQLIATPVGWPTGASHKRIGGVGWMLAAASALIALACTQLRSGWYSSWSCCCCSLS